MSWWSKTWKKATNWAKKAFNKIVKYAKRSLLVFKLLDDMFDTEYKHYVNATAIRVIKDDDINSNLIRAIQDYSEDILEARGAEAKQIELFNYLNDAITNSAPFKYNILYKKGVKKKCPTGMPKAVFTIPEPERVRSKAKAYFTNLEESAIEFLYATVQFCNPFHLVLTELDNRFDYNPYTGVLQRYNVWVNDGDTRVISIKIRVPTENYTEARNIIATTFADLIAQYGDATKMIPLDTYNISYNYVEDPSVIGAFAEVLVSKQVVKTVIVPSGYSPEGGLLSEYVLPTTTDSSGNSVTHYPSWWGTQKILDTGEWQWTLSNYSESTIEIPLPDIKLKETYLMVCYRKGTDYKFISSLWANMAEYPEIKEIPITTSKKDLGRFPPRMYARYKNTKLSLYKEISYERWVKKREAEEKSIDYGTYRREVEAGKAHNAKVLAGTPNPKEMQKFWKVAGFDWNDWVNDIHEQFEKPEEIEQAYVTWGVPANGFADNGDDNDVAKFADRQVDPIISEYLFRFFKRMYNMAPDRRPTGTINPKLAEELQNKHARAGNAWDLKDDLYTERLQFSAITYNVLEDSIGPVDAYVTVLGGFRYTGFDKYKDTNGAYPPKFKGSLVAHANTSAGNAMGSLIRAVAYKKLLDEVLEDRWGFYYFHQLDETHVEVVGVYDLTLVQVVWQEMFSAHEGPSDYLLVPLDLSIVSEMSFIKQEYLIMKSMHLVVMTHQVVKIKWWQTKKFQKALKIAAIVIAVFTLGAATELSAVLWSLAIALAVAVGVKVIAKILLELGVDAEIVAAFIVVATIVTIAAGVAGKIPSNITAQDMLMAANVAMNVQANLTNLELQQIQAEMKSLGEEHEERMRKIKELQDELESHNHYMENIIYSRPETNKLYYNLGESPEDFYNRTIYLAANNPGVEAININLGAVEYMLQLPTVMELLNQYQGEKDDG